MTIEQYQVGQTVIRHGDVLLKKTATKTKKRRAQKRGVLHKGAGNDHALVGSFYVREEDGKKFLGILGKTTIVHVMRPSGAPAEHGPITLTPKMLGGTELEVDIQLEYDHLSEESRQVID